MVHAFRSIGGFTVAILLVLLAGAAAFGAAEKAEPRVEPGPARQILEATGVQGGLVVHLGCGDGRLTAALRAGDGYLVHGLDRDPDKVVQARRHVQSLGLCGSVAIERLEGRLLPYVDNLVKLVVADGLGNVPMDEVMRVLAPGGTAYVRDRGAWQKTTKPRPPEIDQWTHYLHDATNNAVSADRVSGPPRQLQWVGGPAWMRSHDHLASMSAVACSGDRLFYIVDEGPIAAAVLEPKWSLVACDAFSGVILWKRAIPVWQWHLRGFRSGPSDLARRLVAVGQRVYVTLGSDAPLSALDAATGRTLMTYEGTDHALEVVCHEGALYVVGGQSASEEAKALRRGPWPGLVEVRPQRPAYPEAPSPRRIVAIDAETGRLLWKKADAQTAELMPTTLAVGGRRAFFQNADEIVCLDAASGKPLWQAPRPVSRNRPTWSAPTLVVHDDVILSGDRAIRSDKPRPAKAQAYPDGWYVASAGGEAPVGELVAFSAADGKRLWSCRCREGYNSSVDVLVADGLVWTGDLVTAREPGITEGRDPKTGEVKRTRPNDQEFFQPGMGHHRCYRNKATCRYLVLGRSGVEFIDLATGNAMPHHWTRGVCQYGVIPCNGLLYVPPHSCACFITSKLNGFNCLAPASESRVQSVESRAEGRLERGPAFSSALDSRPSILDSSDWPTYRHDAARSGRATCAVPAELKPAWQADLGGRLSSVVVADGRLFVAEVDAHTVHALNAADGRRLWNYTAGGRVDSPPTVWQGRVLFGSADGWVYCLRASDGALAWRFRAAPEEKRIVSYEQVESLWPVPGNVLVEGGVAYCVAGRSSYLDGGIRLCRLEASSGRLLSETVIDHRDPKTGYQAKDSIRVTDMPGALPDVLSCDGASIYLRHIRFDLSGKVKASDVPHLFSPAGFLDDSWWHRTYWLIATMMGSNYGGWPTVGNRVPAGRLLVLDGPTVYGFGRNQYSHTGAHVGIDSSTVFHSNLAGDVPRKTYYQAFAIPRDAPLAKPQAALQAKPQAALQAKPKPNRRAEPPPKNYRWTQQLPVLARAMVLAGDRLFLAGPPDLFKTDDPVAAVEGRTTGRLIVLSKADGKLLGQYDLAGPPVLDGLIAAAGRLYLATTSGKVVGFCTNK